MRVSDDSDRDSDRRASMQPPCSQCASLKARSGLHHLSDSDSQTASSSQQSHINSDSHMSAAAIAVSIDPQQVTWLQWHTMLQGNAGITNPCDALAGESPWSLVVCVGRDSLTNLCTARVFGVEFISQTGAGECASKMFVVFFMRVACI